MTTIQDKVLDAIYKRTDARNFDLSDSLGDLGLNESSYQEVLMDIEEVLHVDLTRFIDKHFHSLGEGHEEVDTTYMHITPRSIINHLYIEDYADAFR